MKLEKLIIKNFRNFTNFELNLLDEKFNLIAWENGAWKSTIFDCFRIFFDSNIYNNFFNEKDFKEENPILIEIILELDSTDENSYLFKDCINEISESKVKILIWFYKEKIDSEWIFYWKKSFIGETDFSDLLNFKVNLFEIKKTIQVIYIDGARTEQNFYEKNSFYAKVWKYFFEKNKESELIKIDKKQLQESEIMKKIIWEELNSFTDFLKRIQLHQDQEITNISLDDDSKLPRATFYNLIKLNLFDKHLDKTSTGWQYIIFTVFVIFYIKELEENIKWESEEKKFYLILMEEPEAHLHPQMQRNLLNFIKEEIKPVKTLNLLVSTHSPNIIRAVRDIKKTICINKGFEKGLPEKLDWDIEEFINKLNIFIDVNKAELFFARWIIFVEWIAEEILLPKLFEFHTWKTLDNYWISVINVNSSDFYCYCLYANVLRIPWVVITDWDITKDTAYHWTTRKAAKSIFTDENYFIGFDTFEIDLIFEWNKDKVLEEFWKIDTEARKSNFSLKIEELLKFDYSKKNKSDYKASYEDKRNSILDNYISKSNLAYSLYSNIDDTFKKPEYITKAFDWILEILWIKKDEVETSLVIDKWQSIGTASEKDTAEVPENEVKTEKTKQDDLPF